MIDESDWLEFASLPIKSGKLRVSDPMFFRDLPPSPTFDVRPGIYRVMAKTISWPNDRRVARLRVICDEPSVFGSQLDKVTVDFAQVGVFDPVVLDAAADKMDATDDEKMLNDLNSIRYYGILQLGLITDAIMPLASSGFGDGGYPIFELLHDGKRVGLEIVFIDSEGAATG